MRRLIAVVAVAFALRVAAVLLIEVDPRAHWGFDMSWYDGVARRLVAGLGYVGFDMAPTAHWPPGYPFLLAAVYWLFGPSLLAAKLANAVLATVTVVLTYRIGCELGRPRVGLVAAALLALFPGDILFSPPIMSEALFAALFCASLWLFLVCSNRANTGSLAWLVFGLLLGAATLVRGTALPMFPAFTLTWLASGTGLRRALWYSLAAAVGLALALLPWIVRNQLRLGSPILIATNGGNAVWIGQSAVATAHENLLPPNPTQEASADRLPNPEREVETDRAKMRAALTSMRTHPGRVVTMMPAKTYMLYKNDRGSYPFIDGGIREILAPERRPWLDALVDGYYFVVLGLALVGTRHFLRREHEAVLLPIIVAWFTLLHAVLFFGLTRFHHTLLPVFSLMAAAELLAWTRRTA